MSNLPLSTRNSEISFLPDLYPSKMEENNDDPLRINSADTRDSVIAGRFYMNKKRKFHDEILGLPLPKHVCSVRSDFPSEQNRTNGSSKKWMVTGEDGGDGKMNYTESIGSGKDSNYFSEDDNSALSPLGDWPSTSSVNYGGCSSSMNFSTINSVSETKSIESGAQPQYLDKLDFPNHSYEDQLLEYGKYDSSEYEYDGIEVCKVKELEDLLHSNGDSEKNFILSSGRWNVTQEVQQDTKKLTIDKEFEEYFSMLML